MINVISALMSNGTTPGSVPGQAKAPSSLAALFSETLSLTMSEAALAGEPTGVETAMSAGGKMPGPALAPARLPGMGIPLAGSGTTALTDVAGQEASEAMPEAFEAALTKDGSAALLDADPERASDKALSATAAEPDALSDLSAAGQGQVLQAVTLNAHAPTDAKVDLALPEGKASSAADAAPHVSAQAATTGFGRKNLPNPAAEVSMDSRSEGGQALAPGKDVAGTDAGKPLAEWLTASRPMPVVPGLAGGDASQAQAGDPRLVMPAGSEWRSSGASDLAQAAARPSLPLHAQLGSANWQSQFGEKLVWMVGRQGQVAELSLTPPALGGVEVRLNLTGQEASAHFFSANPVVREAIESALPRLREMLAEAGVSLGDTEVSSQAYRDPANGQQPPGPSRRGVLALDVPVNDGYPSLANGGQGSVRAGGVDIFA